MSAAGPSQGARPPGGPSRSDDRGGHTRAIISGRVTLDDKYALARGHAFMSGVQALVRLPMLQKDMDVRAGHNTAGFISGYRGSPLGTYDQALWAAREHLAAHDIVFRPGVNEELAATAVWGSQQLDFDPPHKRYDGVFGIWYGKGPGVDRSGDVLKHANLAGTAPLGGVVAIAGDDHVSKSSTLAHQSDHTFIACGVPIFAPANVQDILDLGLHAFALSRYAGVWSGMKTVQEVVESAASVCIDPDRVTIVRPGDFVLPADGVHGRWPDDPLAQEARLMEAKWPAALAYVRANRLNYNVIAGPDDRLGIIASGKAYSDTRQALLDLGLDEAACRRIGLRLHKVNVVWPLEPASIRAFARGLTEILVVEEKRALIEQQLKEQMYHWHPDARPRISGKRIAVPGADAAEARDDTPGWLLRPTADLSPALIARAIASRLAGLGVPADIAAAMKARVGAIDAIEQALAAHDPRAAERKPWFCPGCPHNTSTRVPEGSRATAGIGCHGMVVWMDRDTNSWSQMGGEGVHWVGQEPFSIRTHMFANIGDGTYNHSGSLAIRQAIAADANITYKILFNSAVAMTGGQPVDGRLDVAALTRELDAEGVTRIVVVSDEPGKFAGAAGLASGVTVRDRGELDAVQRELREIAGVTAIVYDQVCATKKRRERKRGTMPDPQRRVVINELVCEGCGDCSVQSNCLDVHPVESEFGRKRRINQDTCNKDQSCVNGFCPSFVTIEGGALRKSDGATGNATKREPPALPDLPAAPEVPDAGDGFRIVVAGVGGTGIVTVGQILGMAAHLEGKGVITQDATGLAQMGGASWTHVQIAARPESLSAARVDVASADLVIACDAVVGANRATLATISSTRTTVVLNTAETPTSAFVANPDWASPAERCRQEIGQATAAGRLHALDAERAASKALGATVYTNMLLVGYAWQLGRVPLSLAAIERAIVLNGVQAEKNRAAFEWGRRLAADPSALRALETAKAAAQVIEFARKPTLDEVVSKRRDFLVRYQDAAYAARYTQFVERVRAAESVVGGTGLTMAVARYLFKLMAYKDEYEVARLHTDREFAAKIEGMFEGDYRIVHHLAPPLIAKHNDRGELVKRPYGPWVRSGFRLLRSLKGLRGTPFDPFGYTEERRTERRLVDEYRATIEELLRTLTPANLPQAIEIANLPEGIRGFGHVKLRHLRDVRQKWDALMSAWRTSGAPAPAGKVRTEARAIG